MTNQNGESEEKDELEDTEEGEEENVEIEEPTDNDNASELKAKAQKANEQLREAIRTKKNWRERALDPNTGKLYRDLLSEKPEEKKESKVTPPADETNELVGRVKELESEREKRLFAHSKKLSPEETDTVFAYAKGAGISPAKALETPFVKAAVESLRTQGEAENGIPRPSPRLPQVEGKNFFDLKPEERRKNFAKVTGVQK